MFAGDGNHAFVFVMRERRAFAGCANGDQAIGAGFDVEVDQRSQHGFVE
jgi:hypothetical protein